MSKKIFCPCWGLFFAFLGAISAQEPFFRAPVAPLCGPQTQTALYIDVEKVDLVPMIAKGSAFAAEMIDSFVTEPEKAAQMKITVPLFLAGYISPVSLFFDELKKNRLGAFYLVDEQQNRFIAIACGERSAEELLPVREKLNGLKNLGLPIRRTFVRHGFLIAPLYDPSLTDEDFKILIRARFAEANKAPNGQFDEIFAQNPDAVLTLARINDAESKQRFSDWAADFTASADSGDDRAKEFAALCAKFFPNTLGAFDRAILTVPADFSALNVALQTDSPESAARFISNFNDFRGEMIRFIGTGTEEKHQKGASLYDALLEKLTPKADGKTVLWRFDGAWTEAVQPIAAQLFRLSVAGPGPVNISQPADPAAVPETDPVKPL